MTISSLRRALTICARATKSGGRAAPQPLANGPMSGQERLLPPSSAPHRRTSRFSEFAHREGSSNLALTGQFVEVLEEYRPVQPTYD